jgi:hypothetical protein
MSTAKPYAVMRRYPDAHVKLTFLKVWRTAGRYSTLKQAEQAMADLRKNDWLKPELKIEKD